MLCFAVETASNFVDDRELHCFVSSRNEPGTDGSNVAMSAYVDPALVAALGETPASPVASDPAGTFDAGAAGARESARSLDEEGVDKETGGPGELSRRHDVEPGVATERSAVGRRSTKWRTRRRRPRPR